MPRLACNNDKGTQEISIMKKFFTMSVFLMFATACNMQQTATQSSPTPAASATLPPIPTATPAPTFTVTPTFTATPVPEFFTDEFNADLGAWSFFQTGGEQQATINLANDALNMLMNSPHTWHYAIHNAHEYAGVFVSAKVSGSPSGSIGLVCGYSQEKGWFEFNVSHEGTFSLLQGKWLADGVAEYRPILNETTEYLQTGNMSYEIGLTCNNNSVFLHIDGKMFRKIDVAYIGLPPGKAGVAAASFDNVPMYANFEWFKISPPEW